MIQTRRATPLPQPRVSSSSPFSTELVARVRHCTSLERAIITSAWMFVVGATRARVPSTVQALLILTPAVGHNKAHGAAGRPTRASKCERQLDMRYRFAIGFGWLLFMSAARADSADEL